MELSLGTIVIIALTVLFIGFYSWGRRKNHNIQRRIWESIRPHIRQYSKKANFQSLGIGAFRVSFPGREGDPFKSLELVLSLVPRHLLPHFLIYKAFNRGEEMIIKANFKESPRLRLELLTDKTPVRIKKKITKSEKVERIDVEAENIEAFTDKSVRTRILIDNADIKRNLSGIENLKYLSLSPKKPHLIFSCPFSEKTLKSAFPLVREIGSKILATSVAR